MQVYDAEHDPQNISDYGRNWGDTCDGKLGWLNSNDKEEIVDSKWEISCKRQKTPSLVISDQGSGISESKTITNVFVEGGTSGLKYLLTNVINTVDNNGLKRTHSKTGIVNCCVQ